jgi:hypothetical protein
LSRIQAQALVPVQATTYLVAPAVVRQRNMLDTKRKDQMAMDRRLKWSRCKIQSRAPNSVVAGSLKQTPSMKR